MFFKFSISFVVGRNGKTSPDVSRHLNTSRRLKTSQRSLKTSRRSLKTSQDVTRRLHGRLEKSLKHPETSRNLFKPSKNFSTHLKTSSFFLNTQTHLKPLCIDIDECITELYNTPSMLEMISRGESSK
jgi:hypothetical protein